MIDNLIKDLALTSIENRYVSSLQQSFVYILRSNPRCKTNVFAKLVHIHEVAFGGQLVIFFILKTLSQIGF